jgi:hypothetical protein
LLVCFEEWAFNADLNLKKWDRPAPGYPYCGCGTNLTFKAFKAGAESAKANKD